MKRFVLRLPLFVSALLLSASAAEKLRLPRFPLPSVVTVDGEPTKMGSIRLVRELHKGGARGFDNFEMLDLDYAILRGDSLEVLAAWLESVCVAVNFDLRSARRRSYEGTVFARLLTVSTSLAALQTDRPPLAIPVGVLSCRRAVAWGELPGDGAADAYVIFATEAGIVVYDPPTRQISSLADFPNKATILKIRF